MDTQTAPTERKILSRTTFKSEIEEQIKYVRANTILELRLPLPIALIEEIDSIKDTETIIRVNWINPENEKILNVLSCMQFSISNYAERGFRLALYQELTKYDGSPYELQSGCEYITVKDQDVIIEKIVVNMQQLDNMLREFVEHCNEFYILHCKPYEEQL